MKLGHFLFYSIIGLQIVIAVFAIRHWPMTDYPMFSFPAPPFQSVSRFSIEEVYPNQDIKAWSHNDYSSIGLNSPLLQSLLKNPFHPDIEKHLNLAVKRFSAQKKQNPPEIIRLNKITFSPQSDGQILKTKELLREIPYAQLSQ